MRRFINFYIFIYLLSGGIPNILSASEVSGPSAVNPLLIAQGKFCLSSAGLPNPFQINFSFSKILSKRMAWIAQNGDAVNPSWMPI